MRARWLLGLLALGACGGGGGGGSGAPLTSEDLARACENAYGCLAPPIDGPTIPECLDQFYGGDVIVSATRPDQIHCLAAAHGDCAVARACIGYSIEACGSDADACHGDSVYSCQGGFATELACPGGAWYTDDSTCVQGSDADAACGLGSCTFSGSTTTSCDGTRVVACQPGGVEEPFDCAELGDTCTGGSAGAGCTGTGAACTIGRCDGATTVHCDGGHESARDCTTLLAGGTCLPIGEGGASCNFGSACTPSAATATCDGNTASLCVLGTTVTLDCIAEGFDSCSAGSCVHSTFPAPPARPRAARHGRVVGARDGDRTPLLSGDAPRARAAR